MKIKLLKKLRKEANSKYRVIKWMEGDYLFQEKRRDGRTFYFYDMMFSSNKIYIIEELNRYKRKYILERLKSCRRTLPRIIR